MEKLAQRICLALSVIGLFLVWFFSPEQLYGEFTGCEGLVKVDARIAKAFYSNSGNYIGILESGGLQFMSVIDSKFSKGDRITLYARASNSSGQCWLFPDKVVENA